MTSSIETRDIAVGDVSFHLNESGRRGAEAIVWLHGSGPGATALSNWEGMIGELGDQFHNIAPDIIGFGDSSHPDPPPQGLAAFTKLRVETLLELLDKLGVAQVNLVGNSMGALISLALVQEAPERVGRIVLMGPAGAPVKLTPGLRKVITFYDEPTAESMAELLSLFVHDPAVFGDDLHRIAKDRLAQAIRPEVARSHRATFAVGEPFRFSEDDLAKVANQTLVVHGSEDRIIPIDAAHYFAKHLPNADLEIVENAGHWLQIEQASRFEALLRAFLVGAPA